MPARRENSTATAYCGLKVLDLILGEETALRRGHIRGVECTVRVIRSEIDAQDEPGVHGLCENEWIVKFGFCNWNARYIQQTAHSARTYCWRDPQNFLVDEAEHIFASSRGRRNPVNPRADSTTSTRLFIQPPCLAQR